MQTIHGGDVYNNQIDIDFSVSVNPLGTPQNVRDAISSAVENMNRYPDYHNTEVLKALSKMHDIPEGCILCGNGSSELFMAICHAFSPRFAYLAAPSFYGYIHALNASKTEIIYSNMLQNDDGFDLDCDLLNLLKNADMIILGNPNNPTGKLFDGKLLVKIADECEANGTIFVLDECFIDFCEGNPSLIDYTKKYKNLIIVRSFTKNFAIPGVRIGYLICGDKEKILSIKEQLPEWNVSAFSSKAAAACCEDKTHLKETVKFVKKEREKLRESLKKFGVKVYESDANFMLIKTDENLGDELLKKHVLIRDCSNFTGLSKGYYRIAVKSEEENAVLIKYVKEILK